MNAKCKKFLTMLLLVCVSIGAAGCSAYSNQRYYERAQLMMGSGEYAEAAELFHQLGEYEDSAEYALYAAALDALQNGVPLTVELDMEVRRRRPWLWDETVYTLTQRFRLEYHTLSRQYLVSNLNSGERRGFPTRSGALRFMGQIVDFPLLDNGLLDPNGRYEGALRARLDIEALPAPLRLLAYLSDDWRLASEWYSWSL